MRNFQLKQVGQELWEIFLGDEKLATFNSQHGKELKILGNYLDILYPKSSEVALTINLPLMEVDVPNKHNVSEDPSDPANSFSSVMVEERDMEGALYTLYQHYQNEFEGLCEDNYLARMGDI